MDSLAVLSKTEAVVATPTERSWSAWIASLTAGFAPATTARRTNHVTLRSAFLIHLVAACVTVVLVLGLDAWSTTMRPGALRTFGDQWADSIEDLVEELVEDPWESVAIVATVSLATECGFLLLAFIVMSWGACDEPIRQSFRHSLRRTWLQSVHAVWAVLLAGSVVICMGEIQRRSMQGMPPIHWPKQPPQPPLSPTDPGYAQAQAEFQRAMADYVQEIQVASAQHWQQWRDRVKYPEYIQVATCCAAALWVLWALLRAVGAPRPAAPIARPPQCDQCGYDLTTLLMEGRCPECGLPVSASIGPGARPGSLWQLRGIPVRGSAWWACAQMAIFRPAELGRQLQTVWPGNDHRRFFANVLPGFALVAIAVLLACVRAGETTTRMKDIFEELAFFGFPIVASLGVGGAVLCTCAAASCIGFLQGLRAGRNLMSGSMQVACYLAGYLLVCVILSGALGALGIWVDSSCTVSIYAHWFQAVAQRVRVDRELLSFSLWFLCTLVLGIHYLVLVARGTAATRFANR